MFTGILQGAEDSQGLLLAVEFRPDGLQLGVRTRFAPDSPTASALAAEAPTALADIGKLPRGLTIYGGSKFGKKISDTFRGFTQQFGAPDGQDAADAKISKLLDQLSAAGAGVDVSGGTGADATISVTQYKSAKQAAAALVGVYQAVPAGGKIMGIVAKEKTRVTEAAQTHRGFTFAEVKLSLDFAATVESLPENVRESTLANLRRFARERMTYWIGSDGKAVATLTAPDWAAASKLLDAYLDGSDGTGSDAGFKTARSNLPAEANTIYLAETSQMLTMLMEQAKAAMSAVPGGGPQIGKLRPVQGPPTYVGFALTLKPQTDAVDVFVPGAAMNVTARMLAGAFRKVE
jgi:hypothetical protein